MDVEIAELMEEHRGTSPDGLLIVLGEELTRDSTTLHSPQELKAIAQRGIAQLRDTIRSAICGNRAYVDGNEADLAAGVASAVSHSVSATTAILVGLYCARRGMEWICTADQDDDSSE